MYADRDRAGYRQTNRRRLADIEFLGSLRTASDEEFEVLVKNHSAKNVPQWKKVAIELARKRREPVAK